MKSKEDVWLINLDQRNARVALKQIAVKNDFCDPEAQASGKKNARKEESDKLKY